MTAKGLGMTVVVDGDENVLGVFTDGDLRRLLDRRIDIQAFSMQEVMTAKCRSIGPHELAAAGAQLMDQYRITVLPWSPRGACWALSMCTTCCAQA